jgi:hypothetical protein
MGLFSKLFGQGSSPEGDPRVPVLIAQCDDPDPARRAEACRELGRLGAKARTATDKLLELMNDVDGDVCNAAADAYASVERGF